MKSTITAYPRAMVSLLLPVVAATLLMGCSQVKPYQRAYLNDVEMQANSQPVANFEEYVSTIREGSFGGGASKGSGGCGCN